MGDDWNHRQFNHWGIHFSFYQTKAIEKTTTAMETIIDTTNRSNMNNQNLLDQIPAFDPVINQFLIENLMDQFNKLNQDRSSSTTFIVITNLFELATVSYKRSSWSQVLFTYVDELDQYVNNSDKGDIYFNKRNRQSEDFKKTGHFLCDHLCLHFSYLSRSDFDHFDLLKTLMVHDCVSVTKFRNRIILSSSNSKRCLFVLNINANNADVGILFCDDQSKSFTTSTQPSF